MNFSRLALMTEWNFAQGKLRTLDDLVNWSLYLAHRLQASYAGPALNQEALQRGAAEILRDLHPVWKKLSYGGRTHRDVSPARRDFLERSMHDLGQGATPLAS